MPDLYQKARTAARRHQVSPGESRPAPEPITRGIVRATAVPDSLETPFANSLCHRCKFLRLVPTGSSTFLMCNAPGMRKYQPQPVGRCTAFEARTHA